MSRPVVFLLAPYLDVSAWERENSLYWLRYAVYQTEQRGAVPLAPPLFYGHLLPPAEPFEASCAVLLSRSDAVRMVGPQEVSEEVERRLAQARASKLPIFSSFTAFSEWPRLQETE